MIQKINNKGQMDNYLVPLVFLFSFGFMTLLAFLILSSFFGVMSAQSFWSSTLSTVAARFLIILRAFDWIAVVLLVALLIALALTSYKINTAKVFFIVSFVGGIFLGFMGYIFSYMFGLMVQNSSLSAVIPYFPKIIIVCTNLHWVSLACYTIGSISLYAKKEIGGEFVQ